MRTLVASLVLATAVTACTSGPDSASTAALDPPAFATHPFNAASSPSPLIQVQAGYVQAVVPNSWEAKPLPMERYPQQGFVAAPRIEDWEQGAGTLRGMEVFWIDVSGMRIPSDYYYLVAHGPVIEPLTGNKGCATAKTQVYLDRPPDLTGRRFSPSDYVVAGTGTCRVRGSNMRWGYVVVAPGFGPLRQIGIPSSGLYVVMAVVSGSRSDVLLQEILESARFGDTPVTQIVIAATTAAV